MATTATIGTTVQPKSPVQTPLFKVETFESKTRYLKLLIYGDYGVGKTYLAGSACDVEQMSDVLMINAEAGDLTLEQHSNLDIISCRTYKQIARTAEYLAQHCKAREAGDIDKLRSLEAIVRHCDEDEIDEPRQYRTVLMDTLTEVEEYCMYQLLGISDSTRLDEETASPEWAEYKRNHNMIKRLIRSYRDLPMNVIFTCAQQWVQDEAKKFRYSPQMTGKLSSQIQGFMDMVGYLIIGTPKEEETKDGGVISTIPRRLFVQPGPSGKYNAKCRFPKFKGAYFDDPTMSMILDAVGLLEE